MNKLLSIRQAAELLGVSTKTIRRWEQEGKIKATRTVGGHRRFNITELLGSQRDTELTIAYVRGNQTQSPEQFAKQISIMQSYCSEQGWNYQIIKDITRGISNSNPGLVRLLKLICSQQVKRLVLPNKDRLVAITADLVFTLCEIFGTEVILLNQSQEEIVKEELTDDIREMINSFNTRLYGSRIGKNQELAEELREIARKL